MINVHYVSFHSCLIYSVLTTAWCLQLPERTIPQPSRQIHGTLSSTSMNSFSLHGKNDDIDNISSNWSPPLLAIITEPDAASSPLRLEQTVETLSKAMKDGLVDLISIRCIDMDDIDKEANSSFQERVIELARRLIMRRDEFESEDKSGKCFPKIVINDNLEAVLASNADGIHVKERNVCDIPKIRDILDNFDKTTDKKDFETVSKANIYPSAKRRKIIGTSAHSIESARQSFSSEKIDYYFVGTCYMTKSHPEKTKEEDLEGPSLPGAVRQAFLNEIDGDGTKLVPSIFAIGGINEINCWEPVQKGANGVAVIRSVMQAEDPVGMTLLIHQTMEEKRVSE